MKNLFCILFLFSSLFVYPQAKYTPLTTIAGEADFITTDNQCNVYFVKGNELIKYNKAGKQLYKYSNNTYGNIAYVDASNMLRVLVYHKDFNTVFFLDNTLSPSGDALNLFGWFNLSSVPALCSSYNSRLWLFDQSRFLLINVDWNNSESRKNEETRETGNLNQLLNDSLQPNMMVEHNNKVYLNNPRSGIIVFDNYGTYYKTIPVKGLSSFQPIGDWVYYASGKKVKAYHIKTGEEKEFEVPGDFKSFRLEMDLLILQGEKSITLYSAQ